MSDAVEDALQAVRDHNAGLSPEEPVAETVVPEVTAPADPPAQKPRFGLDDVMLDDERLPPSLRNQSAFTLAEERRVAIAEAQRLANHNNRLEAERDTAFAALERLAKQVPAQPEASPPAAATPLDRLAKRGIDSTSLLSDARGTLVAALEVGAEDAEERYRPRFESLQKEVTELKEERSQERSQKERESWRAAYVNARPEGVTPEAWDGWAGVASSYVLANNLPLGSTESYKSAFKWHVESSAKLGLSAPTPAPIPAAPAAPAPPVGGGRPAAPPQGKPTSHLNNHQRSAAATIVDIVKRANPSLSFTADDVMEDVKKDPKTRSAFP